MQPQNNYDQDQTTGPAEQNSQIGQNPPEQLFQPDIPTNQPNTQTYAPNEPVAPTFQPQPQNYQQQLPPQPSGQPLNNQPPTFGQPSSTQSWQPIQQAPSTNNLQQPNTTYSQQPGIPTNSFGSSKKSKNKLLLVVGLIIVALLVVAGLLFAFVLNKPSPQELYRSALVDSITRKDNISGTLDIDGGETKFNGEYTGNSQDKTSSIKGNAKITINEAGSDLSMDLDVIVIGGVEKKSDTFVKYNKVSSGSEYGQEVEDLFRPALDKWVNTGQSSDDDDSPSFEDDGAFAAVNLAGLFTGFGYVNEKTRDTFISSADANQLYSVGEKLEKTKFNNTDARKVKVSINKDAFKKVTKEVEEKIDDKEEWTEFSSDFIEQFFAGSESFSADVYLHPKKAEILGLNFIVDFDDEVYDVAFNTIIKKVETTVTVKFGEELQIKPPESSITEDEFNNLIYGPL